MRRMRGSGFTYDLMLDLDKGGRDQVQWLKVRFCAREDGTPWCDVV